jgi:hypothetical protein
MNLGTLELTAEEQEQAHAEIEHLAFDDWCKAGRPECSSLDFWLEAERKWIAFQYVPDRELAE